MRVTCESCQKPTYAGCGAHVEQVLRGVPEAQRCQCRAQKKAAKAAKPADPSADKPRARWKFWA